MVFTFTFAMARTVGTYTGVNNTGLALGYVVGWAIEMSEGATAGDVIFDCMGSTGMVMRYL